LVACVWSHILIDTNEEHPEREIIYLLNNCRICLFLANWIQERSWIPKNNSTNDGNELEMPHGPSEPEEQTLRLGLEPLGYQTSHWYITLGLESTQLEVLVCHSMRLFGSKHVEGTHTEHIEAGVNTGGNVDGHNHDDRVVNQVSIHCKGINDWPPFHVPVSHERHSESCALVEVDQMLLGVMSPLLVDSFLVISLFHFIFYVQLSFEIDLQRMHHGLCLLSNIGIFACCELKQLFVIFIQEIFLTFGLVELRLEEAVKVDREEEENDVGGELVSKRTLLLLLIQNMDVGSEANNVKVFIKIWIISLKFLVI
jgi:hypothetical protein